MKIHVVDDEKANRKLLAQMLPRFKVGIEVRAFAAGQELIDSLVECLPDIAIIDYNMPEMNGFQLAEKLKESGYSFPVFLLTGSSNSDLPDGFDEFFCGVIKKPCLKEELNNAIKSYLN